MNEIIEVTNKTPIEIELQIDECGMTTAKKLYKWLELDEAHYSRWLKSNITENPFVEESEYSLIKSNKNSPLKASLGGRGNTQDYKITATLAKKISMTSKTEKGEEARNYFIGCEQALVRLSKQKHNTEIERAKGIAVRQALTKALQQSTENDRMHGHAYSTYTNCIYKTLFDKNAKQLREELGIDKKANIRDYLEEEELQAVKSMEMLVSGLVDCGWSYDQIKSFIANTNTKQIAN